MLRRHRIQAYESAIGEKYQNRIQHTNISHDGAAFLQIISLFFHLQDQNCKYARMGQSYHDCTYGNITVVAVRLWKQSQNVRQDTDFC